MAGVGLGGFFNGDPNPNPFTDILPPGGALLGDNGAVIVDDPAVNHATFADDEGYDPPTGNGLAAPALPVTRFSEHAYAAQNQPPYESNYDASKLNQLKGIEEHIRDLLYTRKKLLAELKVERDEIDKRLNVSDAVTDMLDEMFPEPEGDE